MASRAAAFFYFVILGKKILSNFDQKKLLIFVVNPAATPETDFCLVWPKS